MPQPGLPVLIPWSPTHCANQHEHVAVVGVSNSDGSLLLTSALDRCSTRPLGPWKSVDMEIQGSWRGSSVVRDTSRGAVARSSKHLQSTKRVPQSMLAHWNCGRRRMTRSTTLSSTDATELSAAHRHPHPARLGFPARAPGGGVGATFPNLSSNDKPMQENRGSSPRIFAQSPDLDKIDSWSSRRS